MADGTILKADCNMAQAFEYPHGKPVNATVSPWRRLIAGSHPRGFPGTLSGSPFPVGHDPVMPNR